MQLPVTGIFSSVDFTQPVPWIRLGSTLFRLYHVSAGERRLLASTIVRGTPSSELVPQLTAHPPFCEIVPGGDRHCAVQLWVSNPGAMQLQIRWAGILVSHAATALCRNAVMVGLGNLEHAHSAVSGAFRRRRPALFETSTFETSRNRFHPIVDDFSKCGNSCPVARSPLDPDPHARIRRDSVFQAFRNQK